MGFGGDSGCDETSVCQDLASGWLVGDEGDVEDSEVSLACTVRELEKPFAENPGRDAGLGLVRGPRGVEVPELVYEHLHLIS